MASPAPARDPVSCQLVAATAPTRGLVSFVTCVWQVTGERSATKVNFPLIFFLFLLVVQELIPFLFFLLLSFFFHFLECPGGAHAVCNGHGSCSSGSQGDGTCSCLVGFAGKACDQCAEGFVEPQCTLPPAS